MSCETQTHVACLVVSSTCGSRAQSIWKETERWISNCGKEWTVDRIKAIWNASLHLRNGDRDSAQKVYQEHSIAYHKARMVPKGPWGYVVQQFVAARRPSVVRRYAAVLRVYTSLTLESVTQKQVEKMKRNISRPQVVPNVVDKLVVDGKCRFVFDQDHITQAVLKALHFRAVKFLGWKKGPPPPKWWDSRMKIHPQDLTRMSGSSYYYSDEKVPRGLKGLPYGSFVHSWLSNELVPSGCVYDLPNFLDTFLRLGDFGHLPKGEFPSRVLIIQEQGCKARIVCQPSARNQLLFYPLHKVLAHLNEECFPKESCVLNQEKGINWVLRHLESGRDTYSVDLSAATDRFPRSVSCAILRGLHLDKYARMLNEFVAAGSQCQYLDEGVIHYRVGQPMGLYGSFPLFHLSNMLIADVATKLAAIENGTVSSFGDGSTFKVLGDDIVFSDMSSASFYKKLQLTLGVEISDTKSFSGKVAEFAGFIALPYQEGKYMAFRPYKTPTMDQVTNPLEFMYAIGHPVSRISRYWEQMITRFTRTLGDRSLDLSPLIGEERNERIADAVSGPYLNALANFWFATQDGEVSDCDSSDLSDPSIVFLEHNEKDVVFDKTQYMRSDLESKSQLRHAFHKKLRQDPLMAEILSAERSSASCVPGSNRKAKKPLLAMELKPKVSDHDRGR